MKTYITSDLHIGHANIIKFCPKTRPYRDVNEMDNSMRNDWNTLIQPEDMVYILGDVAFNNGARAAQYVQSLNGRKILIEGNHDYKNLRDTAFRACFEQVHKYHELRYNGEIIVMFTIRSQNGIVAIMAAFTFTATATVAVLKFISGVP